MASFEFHTVPRVICGPGEALRMAQHCAGLGIRHLLLVTDPGLVSIGLIGPVQNALDEAGLGVTLYARVAEDPPESIVLAAAETARNAGVDGVLAVGGGSSMDVAKVVAVLLGGDQDLPALYGVNQVQGSRLPLILVPTTAGTGSEVTPVAVITTGETTKAGVSSPVLLPDIAVLDADLTLGLPPKITAMTGVDAMVHAIEAYTSRHKKNPVSDTLAHSALALLGRNIRTAVHDGRQRDAPRCDAGGPGFRKCARRRGACPGLPARGALPYPPRPEQFPGAAQRAALQSPRRRPPLRRTGGARDGASPER